MGGQFLCCSPTLKSGGTRPPPPVPHRSTPVNVTISYAIKRLSGQSWSMPRRYGTPPQRKTSNRCGDRAATGCTLREERLPSTQQCDHHARKLELGVPCEQAGGSQARNIVAHYKQLSRRNNIRTHSRFYTHQRQHTPVLSTIHPHRSLQTLLPSEHHQIMKQMHKTIS